jgi:hypothetical protein
MGCGDTGEAKRDCYITVDSATNALQNGACTYQCISKQMHYKKHPFHTMGYMEIMDFYENDITLFCLEKNPFENIILTQNHPEHITQRG